jgi:hypothetical protein
MGVMSAMIGLIKQVPDVVWAAIIASGLTLGGVLLSNRNSRLQQHAALQHDAHQRDREREMSLRREVYIAAAEAISNRCNSIFRLADPAVSFQDLAGDQDKYAADSVALAKIDMVGAEVTVQAVNAVSQESGAAFLELMLKRVPLADRQNEIELLKNGIDRLLKEQEQCVELTKQMTLTGNPDQWAWTVMNNRLESVRTQIEQYMRQRDELSDTQQKESLDLFRLCWERYAAFSRLVPPAILALRDELGLPIDKEAYMRSFDDNARRGESIINEFIAGAGGLMNA